MYNDSTYHDRRRPRRSRSGGIAMIAAGVITTGIMAAGCGGSSKAADSPSVGSVKAGALAYSQCMRAHGIKDFPDPKSNGQIQMSAGPGSDLLPTNPQFSLAQQSCKSLMPGPPSIAQQHKDLAAALKFARCMRSHGVPTFPDPQAQSGPSTQSQSGGGSQNNTSGIDPKSPAFQSAMQKCRSLAPGGRLTVQGSGPRS